MVVEIKRFVRIVTFLAVNVKWKRFKIPFYYLAYSAAKVAMGKLKGYDMKRYSSISILDDLYALAFLKYLVTSCS